MWRLSYSPLALVKSLWLSRTKLVSVTCNWVILSLGSCIKNNGYHRQPCQLGLGVVLGLVEDTTPAEDTSFYDDLRQHLPIMNTCVYVFLFCTVYKHLNIIYVTCVKYLANSILTTCFLTCLVNKQKLLCNLCRNLFFKFWW